MCTPRSASLTLAAATAALLPAAIAEAQWTAIDLTPPGMQESLALGIFGDTQAGSAGGHAALWHGTPESFIDLNPPGADSSWITAISEDEQVGTARIDGLYYGGVWRGTAESWMPLTGGYSQSPAPEDPIIAVAGGAQAGHTYIQASPWPHACVWHGTPGSAVDLAPADTVLSLAFGADGQHQVGRAEFPRGSSFPISRAGVWTGTASSWISLPSAPSPFVQAAAVAISDGQVVGYLAAESLSIGSFRAALWTDFSAAPINLNPAAAYWSRSSSISHGWQAGYAEVIEFRTASVWHGSAETWENLSASLPAPQWQWWDNEASGIWTDGTSLCVVGYARNAMNNNIVNRAFVWTRPTCYPNCDYSTEPPTLNIADFLCFESKFAAGDMYANCDGSTTEPRLNVNDFLCFLSKFAAGCD